jgi:AsmA protein
VKAEQVALSLKAAGGRVDANPVSAHLYEGKLTGSVAVDAKDNRVAVKQQLARVSVGPLLRDAASKDLLEGKGDVVVDVQSAGTTVTQLKQGLAGTTRLALKDGAIKGIDIAGTIRTAKAALGSKSAIEQQAQGGARTDFSDLTATFAIKNGVAHNDDLKARSPLLRLAGQGDIDIGRGTIDYTAKASVVATATGQGGKDLAQLSGVTVPVRATGPLADVTYGVDVQALATGAVKDTLQHELERQLGGKSGGEPKGGIGGVGESLRGLFGK